MTVWSHFGRKVELFKSRGTRDIKKTPSKTIIRSKAFSEVFHIFYQLIVLNSTSLKRGSYRINGRDFTKAQ